MEKKLIIICKFVYAYVCRVYKLDKSFCTNFMGYDI